MWRTHTRNICALPRMRKNNNWSYTSMDVFQRPVLDFLSEYYSLLGIIQHLFIHFRPRRFCRRAEHVPTGIAYGSQPTAYVIYTYSYTCVQAPTCWEREMAVLPFIFDSLIICHHNFYFFPIVLFLFARGHTAYCHWGRLSVPSLINSMYGRVSFLALNRPFYTAKSLRSVSVPSSYPTEILLLLKMWSPTLWDRRPNISDVYIFSWGPSNNN